jgi:hypothetical protein
VKALAAPQPVRLSVLGTPFAVHAADPAELAEVSRLFEPFLCTEGAEPVRAVHLGRGGGPLPDRIAELVGHLTATALSRADCLTVHAGVVACNGRAVAFPAGPGAGKSTLVAACLAAGLDYVSDEALCVSWQDGTLRCYPRPLALTGWTCRLLGVPGGPGQRYVTPAELSAAVAGEPLTLAHVVLLDRQDGVSARLRPASGDQVAAALLERSFTHWKQPERARELAHRLAADAAPWQLTFGDPKAAAALIADLPGDGARP